MKANLYGKEKWKNRSTRMEKEPMMGRNNRSAAFIVALITKRHQVTLAKDYYKLKLKQ